MLVDNACDDFHFKLNINCFHIYFPLHYDFMSCLSSPDRKSNCGFEFQDFEESLL